MQLGMLMMVLMAVGVQESDATVHNAGPPLVHECVIHAPVERVWKAFTDAADIQTWMVAHAEMDLRLGGTLKTNYNANGHIGDDSTIVHEILAFEPMRMLAMRTIKSPKGFPWADLFQQTWGIIYFNPLDAERTALRIVGVNYGTGPQWTELRAFFERGNRWELEQLKKKLGGGEIKISGGGDLKNEE